MTEPDDIQRGDTVTMKSRPVSGRGEVIGIGSYGAAKIERPDGTTFWAPLADLIRETE